MLAGVRAAGAAALLVGALVGCAANHATTDSAPPPPTAPADAQSSSWRGELRRTFLLTGQLEAVTGYAVLVPRTPQWQVNVRWMLDDGSPVEAGAKVVELDTTQVVGDVAQKQIAADTALSELYQKQAEVAVQLADKEFAVEQARTEAEKAKRKARVPAELMDGRAYQEAQLAADRTRVQHENAVSDLEAYRATSEREIEVLRINLDKARRDIERAEQALAAMELRAPRSGIFVVGEHPWEGRKLQLGDSVWVGMKIAEVPDLSSMRVRAWLSDVDDGEIAVGMPATCTIDAYPERSVPGRVSEIGVVAQEARGQGATRRYFDVLIELERADPEIMRPGMSVKVEVETARLADVVLVPRTSLALDEHGAHVVLADGATQAVELGACSASACEVRGGLEPGVRLGRRG